MIAKVVIDLPLEDPFDYLIPQELEEKAVVGVRVRVPFGPRVVQGFIVALARDASVPRLKSIKSVLDQKPILDSRDLTLAAQISQYYGCAIGEALTTMMRHRQNSPIYFKQEKQSLPKLYHCIDGQYKNVLDQVVFGSKKSFVLVPDAYAAKALGNQMSIGLRSSMFEAFAQKDLIVMIDEDNALYKQEQSPMYETRHVLLMAQEIYGFDIVFISQTPSVELMHLVNEGRVLYECRGAVLPKPMVIDLTNYKFLDKGFLSVPVRNALEANIKTQQKTLVFVNRRGSFSVTRCKECGFVLRCPRCLGAMSYSQSKQIFTCHACVHQMQDSGNCPTCEKASWKSFGFGIEKVQKEIANLFPQARIAIFDKDTQKVPQHYDVLIVTVAILRLQNHMQFKNMVVVDIDNDLNRLNIRSSFKAWAMLKHLQAMGQTLMVQTRNPQHPMLHALAVDDHAKFYADELSVRQELKFAPFYHWVAVVVRSKKENNALAGAEELYNVIKNKNEINVQVSDVMPDVPAKLRDQYRFRVMVGGHQVVDLVRHIKEAMKTMRRVSGVITTLNLDP